MSYFLKYPITQNELLKWNDNKLVNPRTNRKIIENGSIYKYINKQYNRLFSNKLSLLDVSNNEEPITLEEFYDEKTKNIIVNQNEYIIYQEEESKRIQAFHFTSIIGFSKNKIYKHPLTQNIIPDNVFTQAIDIAKKLKYNITNKLNIEQLALKTFQYFNLLTIFIDHLEFIKITNNQCKKLRFELSSIFFHNLKEQQKQQFNKNTFFQKNTKEDILNEIIYIMENVSDNDKIFVSYLILGGLVLVLPNLKKNYPFLEFDFTPLT